MMCAAPDGGGIVSVAVAAVKYSILFSVAAEQPRPLALSRTTHTHLKPSSSKAITKKEEEEKIEKRKKSKGKNQDRGGDISSWPRQTKKRDLLLDAFPVCDPAARACSTLSRHTYSTLQYTTTTHRQRHSDKPRHERMEEALYY